MASQLEGNITKDILDFSAFKDGIFMVLDFCKTHVKAKSVSMAQYWGHKTIHPPPIRHSQTHTQNIFLFFSLFLLLI